MDCWALPVLDPALELLDPTLDLHALFVQLNALFFGPAGRHAGALEPAHEAERRQCRFQTFPGSSWRYSTLLNVPLLQWSQLRDLVETLLHEMIHTDLCMATVPPADVVPQPAVWASVALYHHFLAKMDLYRPHWWHCDWPCWSREPDFGYMKRIADR